MRKIFLMMAVLASCFVATAQMGKKVQFGLKGGINLANLRNTEGNFFASANENRTGFHAGALLHLHITNRFAVQPEVVYSSEGAQNSVNKFVTNYINVPVLAQVMFGPGFRLQTGPQLGVRISAQSEDMQGNANPDFAGFFDKTNFSWVAGASYLTPLRIGIDARYNYGLTNVRSSESQVVKSRVIQLGLFYQFQ